MQICDCTLRDGGYYTNWDFKKDTIVKYLKTMENIESVNMIELGYRSKPFKKYFGEFFYCPVYFLAEARSLAPSKKLAVMINEKDCSKSDLADLLSPCRGLVDLVRLAVNPIYCERALELADPIKKMGFEVAFNLMYLSKWIHDEDFISRLEMVNEKVDYLYMVDSYGSMLPEDVTLAFQKVKQKVKVKLGFHGHNNLELALINTVHAIEAGATIVDSTVRGMGRGAGNLKTELFLTYLNSRKDRVFDFSRISDLVGTFEQMQQKYKWGTNLPYMISGAFSLPQAEVMNWMAKHRYTIHSIVMALQNRKDEIVDNLKLDVFQPKRSYQEALIIGGGVTAIEVKEAIKRYIKNKDICLIMAGGRHAEEFAEVPGDKYYCLVGAEGMKFENLPFQIMDKDVFIVPPHPRLMGTILPSVLNKVFELKSITFTKYVDSLLSVSFQIAADLGISRIELVGFDGYDSVENLDMQEVALENQKIIDDFLGAGKELYSFTPTRYRNIIQESIYSYL